MLIKWAAGIRGRDWSEATSWYKMQSSQVFCSFCRTKSFHTAMKGYRVFRLFALSTLLQVVQPVLSEGGTYHEEFGLDCNKRNSCNDSPSINSTKMNCACVKSCNVFDDCCGDAPDHDNSLTNDEIHRIRELVNCLPVSYIAYKAPIYIMMRCPSSYPQGYTRDRCEGFMDALPVNMDNLKNDPYMYIPVTSTTTGILYINVYCALCNDEDVYTFWDVRYVREGDGFDESIFERLTDLTEYLQVFPLDRIDMTHQTEMFHVCKLEYRVTSTCPDDWTNDTIRELCASTSLYVYKGTTVYNNIYCAQCNGRAVDDVTCIDPLPQLGYMHRPASLSLLLDFNAGGGQFISGRVGRSIPFNARPCKDGYVWDPFKQHCTYLRCPEGEVFVNNECFAGLEHSPPVAINIKTCPMIELNFSDFSIDNKKQMLVPVYNKTLAKGEYFLNSTHAFICAPSELFKPIIKFNDIQGYLTVVGNIISITCLVMMLVVYCSYTILRNTPGISLMCLACALILAQALFSIGIHGNDCQEFCYVVSVGVHFGFLAYFFWMNIVAFDIWNTFRSNLRETSSSVRIKYKRFALYALYAWGTPALIIILSVILDQITANNVRPDYAVSLCFLNNRRGLFVLLAIPLVLVLILDIIFFVWTATNIHRVSRSSKLARPNHTETTQLFLFIKLAFVMGLTWIMGFIAAATQVEALWYIFILLNSFQVGKYSL